jgi:hypothetical protein
MSSAFSIYCYKACYAYAHFVNTVLLVSLHHSIMQAARIMQPAIKRLLMILLL